MTTETDRALFAERKFGQPLRIGERPALLVVDLINGFTDPGMPFGSNLDAQVEATIALLAAARQASLPIFYTTVGYDPDMADAGVWQRKIPRSDSLLLGSPGPELDSRLGRRDEEAVILKKYASAYFGTDLASRLTSQRVDTVIIAGCTTSGCVRASAVDTIQYGFVPIVVEQAVGDRSASAHEQSLFDLQQKYADVMDLEAVIGQVSA